MREFPFSRIDLSIGQLEHKKDYVAEEKPLHVFLNQNRYVTILCSPKQLKELAIGHLLSEGIIESTDEIKHIRLQRGGKYIVRLNPDVDIEKRIAVSKPFGRLIVSVCGLPDYWPLSKLIDRLSLPKIDTRLKIKAETILNSVKRLNTLAETFKKTGGVHIAALYSKSGNLMTFSEDIGRHNAVDKVIGSAALKKLDFKECFLALSGRLTGDIVLKSARMRIPLVASIAAAVNSGIDTAQQTGITLIGFARGKRMNVYTYPDRVALR